MSQPRRCGLCARRSTKLICDRCLATGVSPAALEAELAKIHAAAGHLLSVYRNAYTYGYEAWRSGNEIVSGGDHSDPTGETATDPAHAKARAHVAHAALLAKRAKGELEHAAGEMMRALPPEYQPQAEAEAQAPGCINCARYEIWRPIYKARRCQPCYAYRCRNNLNDAPEELVKQREWTRATRRHEQVRP